MAIHCKGSKLIPARFFEKAFWILHESVRWLQTQKKFLPGLFTETGPMGMLQAFVFDAVGMFSPFLTAIVDELSGFCDKAVITICFVKHVHLFNFIDRRF